MYHRNQAPYGGINMNVFGQTIERGSKRFFSVEVGSYANNAPVSIPVIVLRGREDGPVFWITGMVHGEELNGSVAAWKLVRRLQPEDIKGTLIVTPVCNPLALADRVKISQIDYLDMDTAFPGSPTGTWTQRVAHILYGEIKKHANYLLSFHTLAPRHTAKPYTVSKVVSGCQEAGALSRKLAVVFGVEANCVVDIATCAGELPGVTSGALDITCHNDGIPAFMAEMGCGAMLEESSIEAAQRGALNVMAYIGMCSHKIERPRRQLFIAKRKFLRFNSGGLLGGIHVQPGDIAEKGQLIAETHFFGDTTESYFADQDYYIIAARRHPVIHTGERIAFVGCEWEDVPSTYPEPF